MTSFDDARGTVMRLSTGAEELAALVAAAGFQDVHEVPRTWQAPVGFIVGRRRS